MMDITSKEEAIESVTFYFKLCAKKSKQIERLKTMVSWASGKDFDVIEQEYESHKKEFPELHE